MAKKTFSDVRIQTKRDTSANWESNNPVLLYGEKIIVETNSGELREKIGDGVKTYTQLPFTDEPIRTLVSTKVDKVNGKGLSTNDYTTTEKEKLANIEDNANYYEHPETHPATIITEDTTHRFVTDAEKTTWNSKASTSIASSTANGLMSKDDKIKLDSLTNYEHPETHPATMITQDTTHRFVTDSEKTTWNAKASTAVASSTANGLMSKDDKAKLDGIDDNANYYEHPASHAATMITQDATHRFVTDSQISTWNNKASTSVASSTTNGLMSKEDKIKLDGLNEYEHPETHPATMITEDTTHRFVTDSEKTTWNAKASTAVASSTANGLMSKDDKIKLDGLDEYEHPTSHPATMITQDTTHRFVTDTQISTWNAKASTSVASSTANGLMSKEDKAKLDGIAANANNYSHPTHTAYNSGLYKVTVDSLGHVTAATAATKTDITGLGIPGSDTTYKAGTGLSLSTDNTFNHSNSITAGTVSDGGNARTLAFGGKFNIPSVTYDAQGHIKSTGTIELTMPAKPTDYSHPTSHPATMITQDTTHRFVTDDQIAEWGNKADATALANHVNNTSNPHSVTKGQVGLSNVSNDAQVKRDEMGKANGVATLNASGVIPESQLPSYVDDIIEGYYYNSKFHKDSAHTEVITGEGGKIYVNLESGTDQHKTYRWSGSAYVVISETLALGETESTAYAGNKGKANAAAIVTINEKLSTIEDHANNYSHPTSHPATMITQDTTHRFVTDTQISTWNAKASTSVASSTANGLMSKEDKIKLDGLSNYSHPTHTAYNSGLYKIAVNSLGHITTATAVGKTDITGLGIPGSDTNTTYDLAATASATNGNVKLNLTAGGSGSGTDSVSVVGSGAATVTTDSSGKITVSVPNLEARLAAVETKLLTAVFYG